MLTKTAAELSAFTRAILLAAGASERNAERMAEALVGSNLCGVDTHGVFHLPGYVEHIREGYIRPAARPAIVLETPTSASSPATGRSVTSPRSTRRRWPSRKHAPRTSPWQESSRRTTSGGWGNTWSWRRPTA